MIHVLTYPVPISSRIKGNVKISCLAIYSTCCLVGWGPCFATNRVARVRTMSHLAFGFNIFLSIHACVCSHQCDGIMGDTASFEQEDNSLEFTEEHLDDEGLVLCGGLSF